MDPVECTPSVKRVVRGNEAQSLKGVFAIERRRHPRCSIEFPLDYSLVHGKTKYNGGLTADASEGGLLVYLPERIEVGAILKIEIFYAKALSLDTIPATSKVVWSDLASKQIERESRYGLQFQSIDEGNLNKLKTLMKQAAKTCV